MLKAGACGNLDEVMADTKLKGNSDRRRLHVSVFKKGQGVTQMRKFCIELF